MQFEMKTTSITSPVIESEDNKNHKNKESEACQKKGNFLGWEFESEIKWKNVFLLTLLNGLSIYSIVTHDYLRNPWLPLYVFVLFVMAGFGVTGGAHRYWTHRSYKAKLPLRMILILCYASAGQNTIKEWVMDHTVHHKYSDTDADPHNTKRGFFFSHIGWLMLKKHADVLKKGKEFDYSYLYEDPLVEFHDKHFFWFKTFICFLIPTTVPVYLWGEPWLSSFIAMIVRQICVAHATFAINSFAHFFGTKPYNKNICPTNNNLVALYTFGEGFHNYHHTFPWDYRTHDMTNISGTTGLLNFFGKIGWAYDMRYPSQELIDKVAKKYGDGTYIHWENHITQEDCEEKEKPKSL